jgi:hypothetical protein
MTIRSPGLLKNVGQNLDINIRFEVIRKIYQHGEFEVSEMGLIQNAYIGLAFI